MSRDSEYWEARRKNALELKHHLFEAFEINALLRNDDEDGIAERLESTLDAAIAKANQLIGSFTPTWEFDDE